MKYSEYSDMDVGMRWNKMHMCRLGCKRLI